MHQRLITIIALTSGLLPSLLIGADTWVAPAAAAAVANPTPDNSATLNHGGAVYAKNCQVCHGTSGGGDGTGAAYMYPKPAKLSDAAIQAQSDGALFWKIGKGRNLMPGWKANFSAEDRWSVVRYIRTFAAKVPGNPPSDGPAVGTIPTPSATSPASVTNNDATASAVPSVNATSASPAPRP